MKSKFLRLCSMVLVLVMLINMLPMSSFAEEYRESLAAAPEETVETVDTSDAQIVEEIIENRTEFSKEFLLGNGLHMAAVYPDAVHYETDDGWAEIDNTLVAKLDGTYTNTAGVWEVRFPQQLTGAKSVVIEKDGYTLSFAMAGELRSSGELMTASISSAAETMAVADMQLSTAAIQQVDLSAMRESVEHAEMVPDKLQSRLMYSNVYQNTDIIYDLDSNKVKESIVLETYSSTLRGYRYTLNVGTMIPVLEESGQITFYDPSRENIVMVMPAPFLVDDAGEYNSNIQVQLTGKGSTYVLSYLLPQQWLAEEDRAWPVILDPVITANLSTSNIRDRTVAEKKTYDQTWGMNTCGYDSDTGIMRFFLKYNDLPDLTSSDVIVGATIQMYKAYQSSTVTPVYVHKVNSTWASETITWTNKPGFNGTVEDYAIVDAVKWYGWVVTDIVRDWYAGENTGMMFKASNEVETGGTANFKQFLSSDFGTESSRPILSIVFRNNNGLESYWDYTASSAGRAGTGYINNYTGNLVWVRSALGYGGNRMPVSISYIYNANDADNNDFGLGLGWRTNYNQLVYQWSVDGNYYVWEDSDGTRHYFKYSSANTYEDEDGLELILTTNGSATEPYRITDKYGNTSIFDNYGRLIRLTNNQQSASSITITYASSRGYPIGIITDGAGRQYQYYYDSAGMVKYIGFRGFGTSIVSGLTPTYDNYRLKSIQNRDGSYTYYNYNSAGLLESAEDSDGYRLTYSYNTVSDSWQPYRVLKVSEYDGATAGGELTIEYAHNQTTFTDHNGNVEIHQFNDFGNTICIQDDEGHAQYTQYAFDTDKQKNDNTDSTKKGNQMRLSSKLQNTVGTLLKDNSFEKGYVWTANSDAVTASCTTETAYYGSTSLKVVSSAVHEYYGAYSNFFYAGSGETLTFSAYVKSTDAAAQVVLHYYDTEIGEYISILGPTLTPSGEWVRSEVSFTNPKDSTLKMYAYVFVLDPGTVYLDCAQVETAATASRYNLVNNGEFRHSGVNSGSHGWIYSGFSGTDGPVHAATSPASTLDTFAMQMTGSPTVTKQVYQDIAVTGSAGDTFVLAGWAKGDSAPLTDDSRQFCLKVTFYNTDGSTTTRTVNFNPDTNSTESWQYAAAPVMADKAYTRLRMSAVYGNNVNTVLFDGIQLYKEEFGNSYTYDADGNVISVTDLQKQTTTYEYANNDLTKVIQNGKAKMTYTYDDHHNVKTATTEEGLVYNFAYDTYGNNTSVSISGDGSTMTSTATYSSDGNRLVSTTDALGNVTTYSYNAITNVLEWVQYPEDTADTRTEYTYDSMYRMATAACTTDTGLNLSASYTYTDDLLTAIQTPSTTYNFTYGDFGLRTGVSVGNRTLATYSYTNDRNNYLQSLDYGNGDSVDYTYDDKGRLLTQTYEDGDTVSYAYDNNGALAKVTDSATGITTSYYYDFTDRMMKYVESGEDYSHSVGYEYDTLNNLTQLVETINGVEHTTSYDYDDDNRLHTVTQGSHTETYTYDDFGRTSRKQTKNGDEVVKTETYTFQNPTDTTTSGQVATYKTTANGYQIAFSYTYDDNGNIKTVAEEVWNGLTKDGVGDRINYTYDSANQLIREDNKAAERTWTWTYDAAGNILSRTEYAYTTGSLSDVTPIDTVTYTYGDSAWGDLLTAYNGTAITYDGIGNPLSDGTWMYTWEHGRELASMTNGSTTWTYTYNADGMRTSKTNGTTSYSYVYNGSQLSQMTVTTVGEDETVTTDLLQFTYDASGRPTTLTHNGTLYYYVTNLQGDVTEILDSAGYIIAYYVYNGWGELSGGMNTPIGTLNPLRYRGYVYDDETRFYYVSSRYYDPEIGRWINADGFVSTGQDITGYNMFAYCGNNPVNRKDPTGQFWITALIVTAVAVVCTVALSGCSAQPTSDVGAAKPYVDMPGSDDETSPNCYAYAIGSPVNEQPGGTSGRIPTKWNDVNDVGKSVEADLKAKGHTVRKISGPDAKVYDNEFKIALRVGTQPYAYNPYTGQLYYDYHFMRQTNTGQWAEKHGYGGASILWDAGMTPDTIPWTLGDVPYYDSAIIYYAVGN